MLSIRNFIENNRITIFWIAVLVGAGLSGDTLAAADGFDGIYLSQKTANPQQTKPPASGVPAPSTEEKAADEKGKEQKPTAPLKVPPLKPFEPTEKVKADQAVDFPADI